MSSVFHVTSLNKFVKSLSAPFLILAGLQLIYQNSSAQISGAQIFNTQNLNKKASQISNNAGVRSNEDASISDASISDAEGLSLNVGMPNSGNESLGSEAETQTFESDSLDAKVESSSLVSRDLASGENLKDCAGPLSIQDVQLMDSRRYSVPCSMPEWNKGDLILLKTDSEEDEITGVFEYKGAELRVIGLRNDRLITASEHFEKMDVEDSNFKIEGTTFLWKMRRQPKGTRPKFKSLYTQGATIGDTASTLSEGEFYFTVLGDLGYGVRDPISINTNLYAFALGTPNAKIKGRVYRSAQQTWAVGFSTAQERNSAEKLFNLDLMWDSILSEKLIAHSMISAAVISFDSAKDVAALKSYGSSSIQTGYEYLFTDWSRLLMGPSYNLDKKAIGGYLAYLKIFDNFHLQFSLTTTNIREMKFSAEEGYLFLVDAYWRW